MTESMEVVLPVAMKEESGVHEMLEESVNGAEAPHERLKKPGGSAVAMVKVKVRRRQVRRLMPIVTVGGDVNSE